MVRLGMTVYLGVVLVLSLCVAVLCARETKTKIGIQEREVKGSGAEESSRIEKHAREGADQRRSLQEQTTKQRHVGSPRSLEREKERWADVLCRTADGCGECLGTQGCGWCDYGDGPSPSTCLLAGENGPAPPNNCTNGLWKAESCTEDNCRAILTCEACVASKSCGWCDNVCTSIEIDHERECSDWRETECPAAGLNCSKFTDCSACTEQSRCGWCVNQQTGQEECVAGKSEGPVQSFCPEWLWESSECTDEPECSSFLDCGSCLGSPTETCIWCKSNDTCLDASGMSVETDCPDVQVDTCDDECADYTSCNACIELEACGWCSNNGVQYCAPGNEQLPSSSHSCRAGYYYDQCPHCMTLTDCDECVTYGANNTLPGEECQWCRWRTIDFTEMESCFAPVDAPLSGTCTAQCDAIPNLPPFAMVPTVPLDPNTGMPSTYYPPIEPNASPSPSPLPSSTPTPESSPTYYSAVPGAPPPPAPDSKDRDETDGWIADVVGIVIVSVFALIATVLVLGTAAVVFYRYYWIRRHYYLTLR
eukprot:TRINITY_DN9614_c0_g1_i1.p1 TRINITY_DN9614_c0_g1~~TRINITY_DN9614_c0_g1_i1.p1  ORF type:complete len:536 (-),score=56.44 TRINITY_DN9614_c0_g1_i1:355-1962(-)